MTHLHKSERELFRREPAKLEGWELTALQIKLHLIRNIARDRTHGVEASFTDIAETAREALRLVEEAPRL